MIELLGLLLGVITGAAIGTSCASYTINRNWPLSKGLLLLFAALVCLAVLELLIILSMKFIGGLL